MRLPFLLVLAALALFGSINLARADVTTFCNVMPNQGLGNEICVINGDTPAVTSGPGGSASLPVSFPQFNPQLGELQRVDLSFSALGSTGTETLTYEHDPVDHVFFWGGLPYVAFSNPNLFGFVVNGSYFPPTVFGNGLQGFIPDNAPPPTPEELTSSWGTMGIEGSTAPDIRPYIGTGQLSFDVVVGSRDSPNFGCFCPVNTITSLSPIGFSDIVTYEFIPAAVPEPSLLVASAALFGLIVVLKRRSRR